MDINYAIRKEGLRRGLSFRTIKTYIYCVERFFKHCNKDISKISKRDIREYLERFIDREQAGNTINVHLNALKFLFEEILHKNMKLNIRYSKVPKRLPIVLTRDETKRLISSILNEKHRFMIELMYSAGLRVSELTHLRIKDIEMNNNYGWVRGGKGNKDRLFILSDKIKDKIIELIQNENLKYDDLLFQSNRKKIYHTRTLQQIIKKARKRAKIEKRITLHTLRHSFATHLIENGYDIGSIQSLLGHNSPETTMIYIHMASPKMLNVKSPFDDLYLEDNKNKGNNTKLQDSQLADEIKNL